MTTNRSGSRVIIPTVEDVLSDTAIGDGYHDFAVQGGTVRLTEAELRSALEAVYDATMHKWYLEAYLPSNHPYRFSPPTNPSISQ